MSLVSDALKHIALIAAVALSTQVLALPGDESIDFSRLPGADAEGLARHQAELGNGFDLMADDELRDITGQNGSLFVADKITPNELQGALGAGSATDFTFMRMGLDVELDLNLNLGKVQLGCGGINDSLTATPGCDLDLDYLSLMGINDAGDAPSPLGPDSDFTFTRPYIELAIKNETSRTQREVAGIKIGAQRVNGALGIGREYNTTTTNLENGGTCSPGATVGSGVLNCNSGVNTLSGFLSLELSAGFNARADLIGFITTDLEGCLGRITPSFGRCNSNTTPFFVEASGTRLDVLHAAAARLEVSNIDLGCNIFNFLVCSPAQAIANLIVQEGYGQLIINTRLLHYLAVPDTENFFLSFQREAISYPNYSKSTPANNLAFDACNPAYGQTTARCSSAYAPTANTGWWLNAPGAKLLNIAPPDRIDVGTVSLGTVISLLGPEGRLIIDNPKLGIEVPDNCYGAARFC